VVDGGCGCFGGTPYCNASGQCVACLESSQCADGDVCDVNGTAETTETICAPSCAVADGTVCGQGFVCSPTTGTCLSCVKDSDCGAAGETFTPYCDPTGTCVQCLTSPDCGTSGVCLNESCVQCVHDSDCDGTPMTPFCTGNTCVQCTESSQCGDSGQGCQNNLCGCEAVSECPAYAPGCVVEASTFYAPMDQCGVCQENTDCPTGLGCAGGDDFFLAGTCAPICGYDGASVPDGGVDATCAACAADTDCSSGQTCDTTTGVCGT
jgi:hypothetical protein